MLSLHTSRLVSQETDKRSRCYASQSLFWRGIIFLSLRASQAICIECSQLTLQHITLAASSSSSSTTLSEYIVHLVVLHSLPYAHGFSLPLCLLTSPSSTRPKFTRSSPTHSPLSSPHPLPSPPPPPPPTRPHPHLQRHHLQRTSWKRSRILNWSRLPLSCLTMRIMICLGHLGVTGGRTVR